MSSDANLRAAAEAGDASRLRLCLDLATVQVDEPDSHGKSALLHAAASGSVECVQMLIAAGASVNKRSNDGTTACHEAAQAGHHQCLEVLRAAGANMDVPGGRNGNTPLIEACDSLSVDCVRVLLAAGARPNFRSEWGDRPLHTVVGHRHGGEDTEQGPTPTIMRLLMAAGADIHAGGFAGNTPLHVAANSDIVTPARLLLDAGADPNAVTLPDEDEEQGEDGAGDEESDKALGPTKSKAKGDGEAGPAAGPTVPAAAPAPGATGAAASARPPLPKGKRPVHSFLCHGANNIAILELLLKRGADACAPDEQGRTPIDLCDDMEHDGEVRALLVAHGAKDWQGPLDLAIGAGDLAAVKRIIAQDPDSVNPPGRGRHQDTGSDDDDDDDEEDEDEEDEEGDGAGAADKDGHDGGDKDDETKNSALDDENCRPSPLHRAIKEGHVDIVRVLIKAGADLELISTGGETPASAAIYHREPEILALILEAGYDPDSYTFCYEDFGPHTSLNAAKQGCKPFGLPFDEEQDYLGGETLLLRACDAEIEDYDLEDAWIEDEIEAEDEEGEDEGMGKKGRKGKGGKGLGLRPSKGKGKAKGKGKGKGGPSSWLPKLRCNKFGELVRVLIKYGAKVDVRDNCGRTPLHHAIQRFNPWAAVELLKAGANPAAVSCDGSTVFSICAEMFKPVTIPAGAPAAASGSAADGAAAPAAIDARNDALHRLLRHLIVNSASHIYPGQDYETDDEEEDDDDDDDEEDDEDDDQDDDDDEEEEEDADEEGSEQADDNKDQPPRVPTGLGYVKNLLERSTKPKLWPRSDGAHWDMGSTVSGDQMEELHVGARETHALLVKVLKHTGIKWPLHEACKTGDLTAVRAALSSGRYPLEMDPHCRSALWYALTGGHVEVIRALVEAGMKLTAPVASDTRSTNALQLACLAGQLEVMQYLLTEYMRPREAEPEAEDKADEQQDEADQQQEDKDDDEAEGTNGDVDISDSDSVPSKGPILRPKPEPRVSTSPSYVHLAVASGQPSALALLLQAGFRLDGSFAGKPSSSEPAAATAPSASGTPADSAVTTKAKDEAEEPSDLRDPMALAHPLVLAAQMGSGDMVKAVLDAGAADGILNAAPATATEGNPPKQPWQRRVLDPPPSLLHWATGQAVPALLGWRGGMHDQGTDELQSAMAGLSISASAAPAAPAATPTSAVASAWLDLGRRDDKGATPLHYAAARGDTVAVQAMLGLQGGHALPGATAAASGSPAPVVEPVPVPSVPSASGPARATADLSAKDVQGRTPLHYAILGIMARRATDKTASQWQLAPIGTSPVGATLAAGAPVQAAASDPVVRLLLAAGADMAATDAHGISAADLAARVSAED